MRDWHPALMGRSLEDWTGHLSARTRVVAIRRAAEEGRLEHPTPARHPVPGR